MSRASEEWQFVETDAASLISQLVSVYEVMAGQGVNPASPEMLMLRWAAVAMRSGDEFTPTGMNWKIQAKSAPWPMSQSKNSSDAMASALADV